ncbi:hypothetical protein [Thermococcus sp. GR6]|uniref:hypothetical protein n=1 Tax=Thermococcus sp. GR6 TaxID=1638256 RepID=UPI001430592C|nr:hypothetical protein [Thermococcus sp. GR6]NJE43375.1 hypothetical protein [Thermococcus sp. GR6]
MERYRPLIFAFLFVMYLPMLYFLNSRPALSLVFFIGAVAGTWAIERFYNAKVEPVRDERTELIKLRSFYHGTLAFLTGIALEFIWLAGNDQESAIVFAKLLAVPLTLLLGALVISRGYYARVM